MSTRQRSAAKMTRKRCIGCGGPITTGSRSGACRRCMKVAVDSGLRAGRPMAPAVEIAQWYGRKEEDPPLTGGAAIAAAFSSDDYTRETPELDGRDWAVCSDIHVPRHDAAWVDKMVRTAAEAGIDKLCIVGDLMDNDMISSYGASAVRPMSLAEGMLRALQVLGGLATHFREIVVTQGNHDDRILRLIRSAAMSRTKAMEELEACVPGNDLDTIPYWKRTQTFLEKFAARQAPTLAKSIKFLPFSACWIPGPRDCKPYYAVHQAVYSRNATIEANGIWQRVQHPIITTHTHHAGMRMAPNGKDPLVNLGCMTRERHHLYVHERVKGGPAWDRGFAVIKSGAIRLYIDSPYTLHG